MATIKPRAVDPQEIRRWPVMALKLIWKELPAWLLMCLLSLMFCAISSMSTLYLSFLWAWLAVVIGLLLLEKADCNDSWIVFFGQLPKALVAYRTEIVRISCILIPVMGLVLAGKSATDEGITWSWLTETEFEPGLAWFLTPGYVTLVTFVGLLIMGGALSYPLKYILGISSNLSVVVNEMACFANSDNALRYFRIYTNIALGIMFILLTIPLSSFLWPFFLAMSYVACREIFIQPTKMEQTEDVSQTTAVPDVL